MGNSRIEEDFLHYLYNKNYGDGDPCLDDLDSWSKTRKYSCVAFWDEYEHLINMGFVKFCQDTGTVRLTPKGTLHVEKCGYASQHIIRHNREMRSKLLHALAWLLTHSGQKVTVERVIEHAGLEGQYCLGNIELLVGLGYARWILPQERLTINSKVWAKDESFSHAHDHAHAH